MLDVALIAAKTAAVAKISAARSMAVGVAALACVVSAMDGDGRPLAVAAKALGYVGTNFDLERAAAWMHDPARRELGELVAAVAGIGFNTSSLRRTTVGTAWAPWLGLLFAWEILGPGSATWTACGYFFMFAAVFSLPRLARWVWADRSVAGFFGFGDDGVLAPMWWNVFGFMFVPALPVFLGVTLADAAYGRDWGTLPRAPAGQLRPPPKQQPPDPS